MCTSAQKNVQQSSVRGSCACLRISLQIIFLFILLFASKRIHSCPKYSLPAMPVRRHLLAQAIVLLHAVPVWPMKFMGHPSESEHRPVRDSPASPRDQTTSTIKQAGSLSTISRNQPYYDSLFVLAPDASLELTRAFNGLARTRKSCFMNVDYDPRILTEVSEFSTRHFRLEGNIFRPTASTRVNNSSFDFRAIVLDLCIFATSLSES